MKTIFKTAPARLAALPLVCGLCVCAFSTSLSADEIQPSDDAATAKKTETTPSQKNKQGKIKSRIMLTNGDRLTGQPHGLDAKGDLEFTSESLLRKAFFPLEKVLSLELDTWKHRKRPETIARVQLQPSFSETTGDVLLGTLHELTPDSIRLDTWYGGIITLKRPMVKSLQIISTGPGNYYGPNSINEWTLTSGKGSWSFKSGSLISKSSGGIGRDLGLTEKSHISFDAQWKNNIRFRIQFYSSDVSDTNPDACYDLNFNRNYVYIRTRGKAANGGFRARGGMKQFQPPSHGTQAHFDIFVDRKSGTFTVYIDGKHACLLQSRTPDPTDLGTGLSFIADERYPLELSNISVTPWNGTSFPDQKADLLPGGPDSGKEKAKEDAKENKAPHRIILKNGDEVPGTVGKVQDGRMIVETEYTPIRIPLKRIKSLSLGDTGEQPRKYAQDVRAWFHEGGHVTLKLAAFKDGKISGFSQAFGDVTFDLNAFSRIDFHIYNKKLRP